VEGSLKGAFAGDKSIDGPSGTAACEFAMYSLNNCDSGWL